MFLSHQIQLLSHSGSKNGSWNNGNSSKWNVNLTQLHRNTRNCPDTKSGRHRLRLDNVQVVATGDADDEVTATLHAAVSTATEQTVAAVPSVSTAASAVSARLDICHACEADIANLLTVLRRV